MSGSRFDSWVNPIADILWAEDCDPEWLIPNVLIKGSLTCMAGEPGAGKSYVSYTWGFALAAGVSAFSGLLPAGDPVRVVYFDQENSTPDRNKYMTRSWNGLRDSHGVVPDVPTLFDNFIPAHFELGGKDWEDIASEYVEYFKPALIVYDTATSCFGIENENDNAEAVQVINGLRRVADLVTPTATTLVLKHAKSTEKGGERKMRGATAWKGQTDQTFFQVRAPGRPRKDGLRLTRLEPDKARAFGLQQPIYITPTYTDARKTGLLLEASYEASRDHRAAIAREGKDEDSDE